MCVLASKLYLEGRMKQPVFVPRIKGIASFVPNPLHSLTRESLMHESIHLQDLIIPEVESAIHLLQAPLDGIIPKLQARLAPHKVCNQWPPMIPKARPSLPIPIGDLRPEAIRLGRIPLDFRLPVVFIHHNLGYVEAIVGFGAAGVVVAGGHGGASGFFQDAARLGEFSDDDGEDEAEERYFTVAEKSPDMTRPPRIQEAFQHFSSSAPPESETGNRNRRWECEVEKLRNGRFVMAEKGGDGREEGKWEENVGMQKNVGSMKN
nr:hypothetical protein C4D60_Mb08t22710 [Ipomoea trifida]